MEDTKFVCKCKGCGIECCLTNDELVLYREEKHNNDSNRYPKCGRKVKHEMDVFTYFNDFTEKEGF